MIRCHAWLSLWIAWGTWFSLAASQEATPQLVQSGEPAASSVRDTGQLGAQSPSGPSSRGWEVATFEQDITIPIGHACMGGGIADAKEILDPLWAKGFVLRPASANSAQTAEGRSTVRRAHEFPIVVVALDWCQCNNDSYDRWREALAEAAGTTRQRVLLATVHQHDAPICDLRAQQLLDTIGRPGWNCDPKFHEQAVQRVVTALRKALAAPRRVTHLGLGKARVDKIASNRKIVTADGRVHWGRSSASGDRYGGEPEGQIDPWLRTLSLWDNDQPVVAWSCYAVHPMSYYGKGQVSADFPGMARARRQRETPTTLQIYFTGCAGDVTAGKYNNGDPANRPILADRLYQAMLAAWQATERFPLESVEFRSAPLYLAPRDEGRFTIARMHEILADERASRWQRISAALGLSWRERVAAGRPIDVPCLDFNSGQAQFVILPAEAFVGYQLAAQGLRPDSFVMVAGFGDGAPGYIPIDQCWKEGYADDYCWVAPMTDRPILNVLRHVMAVPEGQGGIPPPLRAEKTAWNTTQPEIINEVIHQELAPEFLWFHPRPAAVPGAGKNGGPAVVVTLQKHLAVSDYYSGLYYMRTDDLGKNWKGPLAVGTLDWQPQPDGSNFAVVDVTPGFHAATGKILAIGCYVYYSPQGGQLQDRPRYSGTAYAVYDPIADRWSSWKILDIPQEEKFQLARSACSQWLVDHDGSLLVPIYFQARPAVPYAVTVFRCRFDGESLSYVEHGDELRWNEVRGLSEPSLVRCGTEYYLTIRNDLRGYVTRSKDGLHWEPIRPWTFDDGSDLGSYNTQQHWVVHGEELYLVYTRRGAQNDHIARHRAPLFIGRVDREKLCVIRSSEKVVFPERGAQMGNFGAAPVTADQWWVTVGEYVYPNRTDNRTRPDPKGADGSVLLARLRWRAP